MGGAPGWAAVLWPLIPVTYPGNGLQGGEGGSHTRATHEPDLTPSFQKDMEAQGVGTTWLKSHNDLVSKPGPEAGALSATVGSPTQRLCFSCTSVTSLLTSLQAHRPSCSLQWLISGGPTSAPVSLILRSPIVLLFLYKHASLHPSIPAP